MRRFHHGNGPKARADILHMIIVMVSQQIHPEIVISPVTSRTQSILAPQHYTAAAPTTSVCISLSITPQVILPGQRLPEVLMVLQVKAYASMLTVISM